MNGRWIYWLLVFQTAGLVDVRTSAAGEQAGPRPETQMSDLAPRYAGDRLPAPEPPPMLPPPTASADRPQRPAPMTLADFEAVALAENPALAAARAQMEAARGSWVQAGLYPNTVIGYSANEVGIRDTAGKQGGFISQRFITGGKRRLDRAVVAQEVEAAQFDYHATCRRVQNDVRIRFYDLLIAQRRVELTDKLAHVGEESAAASRDLLKGKQISRTNLLQAEIEAESAHILHDNAVGEHREAWRRLCAVVGVPIVEITPVAGDPEAELLACSWEQCLATVLDESPELAAAGARVERSRLAVCRARRERIPDVDLSVAVRHENVTAYDTASVQVAFPLPLLNRNQGNIYRVEAELTAACAQLKKTELALQDRLAVTYRRYENARHQTERYVRRILPRAKESLESVRDGYREGQVDYLTLLTSQRTYFQANLDYLRSLREMRVAAVALEGLLLTGSLETASN